MIVTLELKYYTAEFEIRTERYMDGTLALTGISNEGPETFSINLTHYGLRPTGDNEVLVKNCDEHEGTANALEEAGVARRIRPVMYGPFASQAYLMVLHPDVSIAPSIPSHE